MATENHITKAVIEAVSAQHDRLYDVFAMVNGARHTVEVEETGGDVGRILRMTGELLDDIIMQLDSVELLKAAGEGDA